VILGDFNIHLEDSFEPIVMRFLDLLIILTVPTGQKDHPPLRWVVFFDSGLLTTVQDLHVQFVSRRSLNRAEWILLETETPWSRICAALYNSTSFLNVKLRVYWVTVFSFIRISSTYAMTSAKASDSALIWEWQTSRLLVELISRYLMLYHKVQVSK